MVSLSNESEIARVAREHAEAALAKPAGVDGAPTWLFAAIESERTSAELLSQHAAVLSALIRVKSELGEEFARDLGVMARFREDLHQLLRGGVVDSAAKFRSRVAWGTGLFILGFMSGLVAFVLFARV